MSTPERRLSSTARLVVCRPNEVEERTAAEVLQERNIAAASEIDEFFGAGLFGETGDLEVGAMHTEEKASLSVIASS